MWENVESWVGPMGRRAAVDEMAAPELFFQDVTISINALFLTCHEATLH